MDTRLFLSTFVLIFLAELGDKTQLATLARAAGEDAPWSVFLGASAALVLSTLVAVLCGKALNALVPPAVIKSVAGGLFIVFGVMILVAVFRAGKPVVSAPVAAPAPSGVAALVLDTALAFEDATARHYAALAEKESDPRMASLWRWLHEQETGHLRRLRALPVEVKAAAGQGEAAPLAILGGEGQGQAAQRVRQAAEHERSTAAFYRALAEQMPLRSAKAALLALAADEDRHAERLEGALKPGA